MPLLAWAQAVLGAAGTGPAEPVKDRPWSRVLRLPTADGVVWLKESRAGTRYEAALTLALGRCVPDDVVVPLAVDPGRAYLLLPDAGLPLRETTAGVDPDAWARFAGAYADLQRRLVPHVPALLAAGAPDQRPRRLPALLDALDPGRSDDLSVRLADAAAMLAQGPPPSIQHDDLHAGNVLLDGTRERFFDWGDAAVAHPLTSALVMLRSAATVLDAAGVRRVRDAYLEPWSLGAAGRPLLEVAAWTGALSRALAWRRALAGVAVPGPWAGAGRAWLDELAALTPRTGTPRRAG